MIEGKCEVGCGVDEGVFYFVEIVEENVVVGVCVECVGECDCEGIVDVGGGGSWNGEVDVGESGDCVEEGFYVWW